MPKIGNIEFGILQYNIVISFLVIFIIFLIVLIFNYTNYDNWRTPQKCPDFWVEEENGQCYNIKGLGKCLSSNIGEFSTNNVKFQKNIEKEKFYYMDFNNLSGGNTPCNKQKWASGCDIAWDGITYGYGKNVPCS